MTNTIKNFLHMFLAEGIFLIVLGALILILPRVTTFALAVLLSIGLILVGVYKFINTIVNRHEVQNAWLSMLISILMIGIGIYLTMNPFFNILVLTMAIGIYFILDGIFSVTVAIQNKNYLKYWWVALIASIFQFVLAFIIIFGLPFTALWTLGILIGINLIFSGIALISLYNGSKELIVR